MRKFVLAAVGLMFSVGLALAAEYTFVDYNKDKKEVTLKDKEGNEVTAKVTDKTTFKQKGKDDTEKDVDNAKGIERLEKAAANEKAKGKMRVEAEVDKTTKEVKSLTFRAGKKK